MEKDKIVEALRSKGYDADVNSSGIIYCYGCDDHKRFSKEIKALGYTRSFGSTPRKRTEI